MDARIRTGAAAYDAPAGAGYCPPAGAAPGQRPGAAAGTTPAGGTSGVTGSAAGTTGPTGAGSAQSSAPYSSSFGDVGMTDPAGYGDRRVGSDSGANGHTPADAFKDAGARLGELKEFAAYYVAAKLDGIKVTLRNVGIYAGLGIVGLIAGSAIISTAAVLLLVGLALGLGDLLWDQYWLGALLVGLLVLGGLAGGIIFGMKKITNSSRKAMVEKYENRQRDQRIHFGEDVRGRRAGSTGEKVGV